jgi:hypothetical protein
LTGQVPSAAPEAIHDGQAFGRVASGFRASAIGWCIVRGEPRGLGPGRDVDLLVDPADLPRAEGVLREVGFGPLTDRFGRRTTWATYDPVADRWIRLDLAQRLELGRIHVPAVGVLERTIEAGDIPRLAPDDEFWSLLLHGFLDHATLRHDHGARLAALAPAGRAASGPVAEAVHQHLSGRWRLEDLADAAGRGAWGEIEAFAETFRASGSSRSARRAVDRAVRILRRLAAIVRAPAGPGPVVALVGPDGIATSTVAASIAAGWVGPARTVRIGQSEGVRSGIVGRPPGRARLLAGLARAVVASAGARLARRQGRLVVLDDVPRILRGLVPAPDLVVTLDATGDNEAIRRSCTDALWSFQAGRAR